MFDFESIPFFSTPMDSDPEPVSSEVEYIDDDPTAIQEGGDSEDFAGDDTPDSDD